MSNRRLNKQKTEEYSSTPSLQSVFIRL